MTPTPADIEAMEQLAVAAWPASETAIISGWLWRMSGGGSQRANSVATHSYAGAAGDLAGAIGEAEQRYAGKCRPAWFQICDASKPAGLDAALEARGYRLQEPCSTMAKVVEAGRAAPTDVEVYERATPDWLEVYLSAITPSRREVNRTILERVPRPRAFFACRRQGEVISTGLSVAGGGFAVIECMATREQARRQGGAQAVLAGIEAWAVGQGARMLFLQAVAANRPAIALYEQQGFRRIAGYHYRVKD